MSTGFLEAGLSRNTIDFFESRRHATLNALHTWLLVGGSILLLAVCAYVFFGPDGIVYAAIFGGISLFMASRVSPAMVLRMYKARETGRHHFPAGHEILDVLTERSGLQNRPKLYVIPSKMMNAFAVGRGEDSAIAMTDQLARTMTRRELAGIMAHEISHIRNNDLRVMAIADMVSRFTSAMSTFGLLSLFLNLPSIIFGHAATVPWLAVVLLIFAPTMGSLLQLALSRAREYDADLGAALLTGDPDGLASALVKLEQAQNAHWESMVLPGGRVPAPSVLRTHPQTADRIERLMALKEKPEIIEEIAGGRRGRGDIIPDRMREELPRRSSGVPKIRRKWGRGEAARYSGYANLLNDGKAGDPGPWRDHPRSDDPASGDEINPPNGKPRIRVTRGGVWW
jgi:heat shock protein HtpX